MSDQDERREYENKLSEMSEDELISTTESMVWLSSFAANNPRSAYHWKCDATYDEAKRREKPWLYQCGWNRAYSSNGHELGEVEIKMASPDYYNKKT